MSFFLCNFADEFKKRGFFTKLGFKNYTYPILWFVVTCQYAKSLRNN